MANTVSVLLQVQSVPVQIPVKPQQEKKPALKRYAWGGKQTHPKKKRKDPLDSFWTHAIFQPSLFFSSLQRNKLIEPSRGFLFFGRVELLSKDSRASCHEDPLTRGRFALSFWARISMKSELCPLSASNRKLSIIKWASHKCDIKTSENKKLHYNASSSSISISLTKNWKWRQCNIGFNFLHCHVTLNLLSIIFFKVWRSFSSV